MSIYFAAWLKLDYSNFRLTKMITKCMENLGYKSNTYIYIYVETLSAQKILGLCDPDRIYIEDADIDPPVLCGDLSGQHCECFVNFRIRAFLCVLIFFIMQGAHIPSLI